MTDPDEKSDVLNAKDLAQVDATIIGGALVFLAIASSLGSGVTPTKGIAYIVTIVIIFSFATSLGFLLRDRPGEAKQLFRIGKRWCMFGIIVLTVSVLVLAFMVDYAVITSQVISK